MNEQNGEQTWLTPEQAAPAFGFNLDQMHRALREKQLPSSIRVIRLGRRYRLHRADVLGIPELPTPATGQHLKPTE